MDVLVLGGGVLGCSAALALVEEGHDVTLRDRAGIGSGSSSKAAGIVSTMTWHDDEYHLIAQTRGKIGELISMAMIEGDPAARGLWKPYDSIVIGHGDSLAHLDEMQNRLERNTEEPERFDWRAAQKEFPGVTFAPGDEVLVAQEDGAVEPGDLMSVLANRLRAEEVVLEQNSDAGLDGDFEAKAVAGGAWTAGILAGEGASLPVQAYRTQLTSLSFANATQLPMVHDLHNGFYTRPESQDTMMAGNGTQLQPFDPDDFNQAADPDFVQSIASRVVGRFDAGERAAVRAGWAGLCVATPDRHPLCGKVQGHDDLFVLTGDNGFGVMRSLALGERLADTVEGQVHNELDPARFGDQQDFQMREGFAW